MTLHSPILRTHTIAWPDVAACEALARDLAKGADIGRAFMALRGPLGAGKTTLARALLRALGVQGRIKSPTYALLEPYDVGGLSIAHIDLYRMNSPDEWPTSGLRDTMAAEGLKLVEWPERAGAWLPQPDMTLTIQVMDDDSEGHPEASRTVTLDAHTALGDRWLSNALALKVPA